MKELISVLLFLYWAFPCFAQSGQDLKIPLAPEQNRRPGNFRPSESIYSPEKLKDKLSVELMQKASRLNKQIKKVNALGKWRPVPQSLDSHQAPEWFKDAKFGMFIDWGLWSVAGWAPKRIEGAMYPDWYEYRMEEDSTFKRYHRINWGDDFKRDDLIPLFNASDYNAQRLVDVAKAAGMKYIIPFCKHHSGFCLWPSSLTLRDAADMGPKKDLIKPLVESCKKEGLKFGFYVSIEEWEYPLIGENGTLSNRIWGGKIKPYSSDLEKKCSGKIPVKNFAEDYLVPQAVEFIDQYDPDILWYDGDWSTNAEELHSYDIAAYFYNKAEGRKEVAVNDRYGKENGKWLRSKRGDIFTNEYGDMEKEAKQTFHAWEENRGISQSFGYNWQDTDENVISSKKFIDMFIDIVANGGNLLLIVNLDGKGALPAVQEARLKDIGKWLNINREAIYATRPFYKQLDGTVAYTQNKDKRAVFAILKEWPGSEIRLTGLNVSQGARVNMLGYENDLAWSRNEDVITVKIPKQLQDTKKRPCEYAWVLKFQY